LKKTGLSGVRSLGDAAEVQRFEGERVSRHDALARVIEKTPKDSTVVLASTGFCGRELYAIDDRENQLYLVGSMGCVTPMALGLALSRPDLRVIALDGDGAALMRMGVFATLGAYGPSNLVHLLLDNGAHESTGGQATVSGGIDFASIASACGYALALDGEDIGIIDRLLDASGVDGVRFARLSINTGTPGDLPRPKITPEDVRARLQQHIGGR
jgi:phosphonopyruvate decarboxylase